MSRQPKFANEPNPPKGIGLRSNMRAVAITVKIIFDHVIRRPNALSAARKRSRGLTFAEAPLSAISRFTWSLEASGVGLLFKASHEDGSSFRADLEQSTQNRKAFMKFVSLRT